MLGIKTVGATLLPFASLCALLGNLLLLRALLLDGLAGLLTGNLLLIILLRLLCTLLTVGVLLLLLGVLLRVWLRLLLRVLLRGRLLRLLLRMSLRVWLRLLLRVLLRGWLLRLLLRVLLRDRLLLLLRVLLRRRLFLLLLGALLRRGFFLWLLRMLLRGRPLLLLAFLLRRLCLPVGFFLPIAFLLLLCVPEHGGSKKQHKDCRSNDFGLLHRYFLACRMNPKERHCCPILNILEICRRGARASPRATPNAGMFISEQKFPLDAYTMGL